MLGVLTIIVGAIFFPLAFITSLAIVAVSVGYFPYFWSRDGQTPGMSQMKIKVVRDADGGPVTVGSAILRFIGLLIGLAVFYIGVIWIFFDKRKRGWQDLIGGTVVVDVAPRRIRLLTAERRSRTLAGSRYPVARRGGRAVDGDALEKR